MQKKKIKYNKEYILYKDDDFIAMGTMKEIALTTNKSWSCIRHFKTETKRNPNKRKGYMLYEVEE